MDITLVDKLSPARLRQVNDLMRKGLRNLGPAEPIAFFCECDDRACYDAVWLMLGEYDTLRADPRATLLAEEHRNGHRGRAAPPGWGQAH